MVPNQGVSLEPIANAIAGVIEELNGLDLGDDEYRDGLRVILIDRLEALTMLSRALCPDPEGGEGSFVPAWTIGGGASAS